MLPLPRCFLWKVWPVQFGDHANEMWQRVLVALMGCWYVHFIYAFQIGFLQMGISSFNLRKKSRKRKWQAFTLCKTVYHLLPHSLVSGITSHHPGESSYCICPRLHLGSFKDFLSFQSQVCVEYWRWKPLVL